MSLKLSRNRCLRGQSGLESLWRRAKEIVRAAPANGAGLDFETTGRFILIALSVEANPATLAALIFSALEDESLEWLADRLDHELEKIA